MIYYIRLLLLFCSGSEEEGDGSLSLAASEGEEWSGSVTDPIPPFQSSRSGARARAVEDLGLEWSSPEEPTKSRFDEWFLPGAPAGPSSKTSAVLP